MENVKTREDEEWRTGGPNQTSKMHRKGKREKHQLSYFSTCDRTLIMTLISKQIEKRAVIFAIGVQKPHAQEMTAGEVVHLCLEADKSSPTTILFDPPARKLHKSANAMMPREVSLRHTFCPPRAANGLRPIYSRSR